MKPLDDIRVLSVTVFLAGPFLSMTLARFGAEVIKIEMPGSGDPIREIGPFTGPNGRSLGRETEEDLSIRFLKRSEGVKSITLNLKDPEGKRMFLELAKGADVVVENLSPGSMTRLGLGYADVVKVNPGIVYCSIAGYGQTGPYKDLPAHDHQIQAMSGIMDMNGAADGPPTRVGVFVGDLVTPLYAAYSILGALRHKEKTGEGQYLDASMIDTLATLMFMEPMEDALHDGQPVRAGNDSRQGLTGLYRLSDGDVIITLGGLVRWQNLCKALGADELLANPRYATVDDRERHVEELRQVIQDRLGKFNCKDGIALLAGANIPIARVRTLPEVMQDEHFRDRGTLKPMYRQDSDEPVERGIVAGFPVTFSSGPLPQLEGGAKLGHHNEEVYGRLLDLDAAALAELKERGIL
ncbi:MAG: CoA transferase [Rhodospirillaceae bacterium]|jgi:crotonobetainyl-CoA:carnitine CoA-transferase CaiB-like acyl-CoA transferase|nr:CoA transferase [Rhodospirillaceae bacterium]MBT3493413.1 CoA transferase [Rhodospirillaceae bacterium]MBT3778477.1 CoA transferase [Rhodospirillaceae bacterium]MBT3975063.1 CoA transferase [Rhodospirillaceae bacterium]MBT4563119.1 CoA transferase [Rhodospirillaceae bacterium]